MSGKKWESNYRFYSLPNKNSLNWLLSQDVPMQMSNRSARRSSGESYTHTLALSSRKRTILPRTHLVGSRPRHQLAAPLFADSLGCVYVQDASRRNWMAGGGGASAVNNGTAA